MRRLAGAEAAAFVEAAARRDSRIPEGVEASVRAVLARVRSEGEPALREFAERWDGLAPGAPLRVPQEEMVSALAAADRGYLGALRDAAAAIRSFAERQRPQEWRESVGGLTLGQLVRPLESVGCYVPGGRHPLPSTLLMTVIPAQVAGVPRIVVVSPKPASETLTAAALLGVTEFYAMGGAQAVAALAFGAGCVPRVRKIVGPGNWYVTLAKKQVALEGAADTTIDMLAGPTEAVIVAEESDRDACGGQLALWLAADLVAQAEHDPEAFSVFITSSPQLADEVAAQCDALSAGNDVAQQSLATHGAVLLAASHTEAIAWANQLAAEHLTVAERDLPFITSAGSVFVGPASSQAFGDYASGPNHVLPTAGAARVRGGLSVLDFVKIITVQQAEPGALPRLCATAEALARVEGLTAHATAAAVRRPANAASGTTQEVADACRA